MHRSSPWLLLPLLSGCSFTFGTSYPEVDGVRLKSKHLETLELPSIPAEGLVIAASLGDVRVTAGPGPTRIEVEVYGTAVGDGHAEIAAGALVARSSTDRPVAIGAVTIHASEPFPRLEITTGMGDIEVRGVRVVEALVLETGMGDVVADGVGEPASIRASSGMGDVDVARSSPRSLEISSGMGDVSVDGVQAGEGYLESGLGDVSLWSSRFENLTASTGLGDVECSDTTYVQGDLDSGLGSVDRE